MQQVVALPAIAMMAAGHQVLPGGRASAGTRDYVVELTDRKTGTSHPIGGNRAKAVAPHGRFAEAGGIFMSDQTTLTMVDSSVSDTVASLESRNPVTNPSRTPGWQCSGHYR